MVADRGLRDVAAGREVARADAIATRELAQDREPGGSAAPWSSRASGSTSRFTELMVLTNIDIVKYQYRRQERATPAHDEGAP